MLIIDPSYEILCEIRGAEIMRKIEMIGRVCYKSESKITNDSAEKFVRMIIDSGHESVIEHEIISVKVICDRGISHEIVRHRIASYSQESTRYCNYANERFGRELTLIRPFFWNENSDKYAIWVNTMKCIEDNYNKLIEFGAKPEEARTILPNSLKTEVVMTMNLREWRHFFELRTSKHAHPQMKQIAIPILREFKKSLPAIFDDINEST